MKYLLIKLGEYASVLFSLSLIYGIAVQYQRGGVTLVESFLLWSVGIVCLAIVWMFADAARRN